MDFFFPGEDVVFCLFCLFYPGQKKKKTQETRLQMIPTTNVKLNESTPRRNEQRGDVKARADETGN